MGVIAEAVRSWLGPYGSGDKALIALFGGKPTAAGVSVNEFTALNISAVYCAINIISGAVSSLPLILYKSLPNDGKERFTDHRLYKMLHDEPNPETTSMVFRRTLQAHALSWGNGYAEIQMDQSGMPAAVWQITPDRVEPYREPGKRAPLRYRVAQDDGTKVTLDADRMLHLPGLGWDGLRGYSVIHMARESLGLTAATERFGSTFFGNGATAGLTAHHPGKLSEAAHARLKTSLTDALQGPNKAHNLVLLEEGVTIEKITIPPDDAQFLETRKFQTTEVARWFNIPPHMLKDLDRATFSNIEQQSLEFVLHTLTPWLVLWEQELTRKLIRPLERRQQFIKHNVKALLRGDTLSRYQAHAIARQWGWESANDVLKIEDENPIGAQGDIYLVPSNMAPADRIHAVIDAQIAPKPAPLPPASPPARSEPDPDDRMRHLAALIVEQLRPDLPPLRFVEVAEITQAAVQETLKALPPTPQDPALLERLDHTEQRLHDTVGEAIAEGLAAALTEEREQREQQRAAMELGLTEVRDATEAARAELASTRESVDTVQAAAAAAQVELRERLDASEVARQAQTARMASLVPSLRDVLEGAVRKEVRFEAERARKAAQSPEKLRAWLGSFYVTREDSSVQFLLPTMRLSYALTGRAEDAETETRRLIGAWVAESQTALAGLLEHPETLEADVKALVARWELERPAAIADKLLSEVIANGP